MNLPHARLFATLCLLATACGDDQGGPSDPVDAGPPCVGEATSCRDTPGDSCSDQLGCASASGCYEAAPRKPCEERDAETDECRFAPGCGVSVRGLPGGGVERSCSGTLRACELFDTEERCTGNGCAFGDYCEGEATSCAELEGVACGSQAGCAENP